MANSLLEDAIGFVMENLQQAGQAFKESNERDRSLIQSYKSGGQVDPVQRQGMLEEYIGHANPMTALGGMIKPSTWAKYTPEAKAMVTEVANRSPQKFEQVLTHPDDLLVTINKQLPSHVVGQYKPGYGELPSRVHLRSDSRGIRRGRVTEHELQHYLNDHPMSRLFEAPTEDAWTVARLLQSRLPREMRGSLDRVIDESTERPKTWTFDQSYDSRPLKKMGPYTDRTNSLLAMDEGLAHTAQAAARPGASPEIRKLARDLGVSWEDETKEVLWGGKYSPSWNPRDVRPTFAEQKLMSQLMPSVDIPRQKISEGALDLWNALRHKLGIKDY